MNREGITEGPGERPLSRGRFFLRLAAVVALVAFFQVFASQYLLYKVFNPSLEEFGVLLSEPGPGALIVFVIIITAVIIYMWPVMRLIGRVKEEGTAPEDLARTATHRGLNFPYVMVTAAFVSNTLGGFLTGMSLYKRLPWGAELIVCLVLGGVFIALLAAPLAIYAYAWLMQPAIDLAEEVIDSPNPARRAGAPLSVRSKLILIITSLVVAVGGYVGYVGYSHASALLRDLKALQSRAPENDKAAGARDNGAAAAPGEGAPVNPDASAGSPAELAARWEARLGNLKLLYGSLLLVAALVAAAVAALASREISGPVETLAGAARRVREGSFKEPIRMARNDELASLAEAFNHMAGTIDEQMRSLESVLLDLEDGIHYIDETIATVVEVASQQAGGATQQASAVAQSSAVAEQIVATAKQISERAGKVLQVSESSLEACDDGENKMSNAIDSFQEIADQSRRFGEAMRALEDEFQQTFQIVELMEEIGEQTELLAMNASLEAAGAGEHGRRFGVVAEATGSLSKRSNQAARKIRELIENIQVQTMKGVESAARGERLVDDGGVSMMMVAESFANIKNQATSTSDAVGEITISTAQQTTASEQLAQSMSEISEVARAVEDGAREIRTTIAELREFAVALHNVVGDKTRTGSGRRGDGLPGGQDQAG